jgi:DNA-binding response OmpR family regulator
MANIRALQERATRRKPPAQLIPRNNILISPKRREVFVSDKEIKLTKIEFDLLYFLTNNRGIALSSEQIYNKVWKNDRAESVDAVVKSAINRLRKKIDLDENKNSLIENLWGVGYRLPTDFDK